MGEVVGWDRMHDRWEENFRDKYRDAFSAAECPLCDGNGYRGVLVCDHIDRRETNAVGIDMCRAALAEAKARKARRQIREVS